MSLFHNSKRKLRNIQRSIDCILDGDFPIASGQKALEKLRDVFFKLEKILDRAGRINRSTALVQIADTINLKVLQVLPILGFILRSTNVRNAFEVLEPLQTIAEQPYRARHRFFFLRNGITYLSRIHVTPKAG